MSSLFEQFAPFFTIAALLLTCPECALSSFHSVVCIIVCFLIFVPCVVPALLVCFQYVHAVLFTCISYCTFKYFEFFEYRVSHGIQISFIQRSTAMYICKVYIVLCSKSINVLGLVYSLVGSTSLLRNLLRPMLVVHTKNENKKYFGSAHEGFVPHALVVVRQFLSVSPLLHIYVYENFHCSCVVDLFRNRKCL